MPRRKDITVRFCLNKGEGEQIKKSMFSEAELKDVRKCLSFCITFYPNEENCAKLINIQILHDGITPMGNVIEGFFINRKEDYPLVGYPTPVVRFLFDRAIDDVEFLKECISDTSYCARTELMNQNDEESYFAEDHNGYSSILSRKEREEFTALLRSNNAYCGMQFSFPEGMPMCGYPIPALEFALKPTSKRVL